MSPESFESSLDLIGPVVPKETTRLHEQIPAKMRLAVTLWYLASSETQQSRAWSCRFGRIIVSKIIGEIYQTIWEFLS